MTRFSLSCFKMVELHFIFLVLLLFLPWREVSADRKVNIRTYQCPEEYCHDKEYIVHATADSKERNNSIHYLYSTMHSPTIIVAYFEDVPGPIDLNVSWNKLVKPHPQKDALRFSQDWDHFMAFVVPRVIVFDDPKDELFYTAKHIGTISTRNFATVTWNPPKITGSLVEFTGDFLNGSIRFRCNVSSDNGRDKELPSLLYTENSTRFSFTFKGLKGPVSAQSRLGLELFSVSPRGNRGSTILVGHKSIDDEYTPAVFKTVVMNSTGAHGNSHIAWKPVAYTKASRNLDDQIPSYEYLSERGSGKRVGTDEEVSGESIAVLPRDFNSIAFAFQPTEMNVHGVNISFGKEKDGWYQNYDQLSWTALVGYGDPQFDTFSSTILITIIAGLGAPLVVLLCGGVFVGFRKYKEKRMASAYGRIN